MRQRPQAAKSPMSREATENVPSQGNQQQPQPPTRSSPWEISSDDDNGTLRLEQNHNDDPYSTTSRYDIGSPATPDPLPPYSWRQYNNAASAQQYHHQHGGAVHDDGSGSSSSMMKHRHYYKGGDIPNAPNTLTDLRPVYARLRTPKLIPDKQYEAYLLGRSNTQQKRPPIDPICCSKFCAAFSFVAVSFLVFIGLLLDTQPIMIKGVLPEDVQYIEGSKKMSKFYTATPSERLAPASHAYQAALFYLLTGLLSLGYAYNVRWWFQTQVYNDRYTDIPDADSTIPTFHQADSMLSDDHHHHLHHPDRARLHPSSTSVSPTQAYNYNRNLSTKVVQFASLAWNRAVMFVGTHWTMRKSGRRRRGAGTKDV